MQSLTKDAELKIQKAIERLCQSTDGQDACQLKEAAVKVARDFAFEPDMIRLMSIGYNNGMATHVRESHDSILEKLAEFPLLDPDEIIKGVFLSRADKKAHTEISSEYDSAPRNILSPAARRQSELRAVPLANSFAKAAGAVSPGPATTLEEDEEDELGDGDALRLFGQADRLKRAIHEARQRWSDADDSLRQSILDAKNYFKRASHDRAWSFGNVEYAINHRYGNVGGLVMGLLKQASGHTVSTSSPPTKPIDWSKQPFDILGRCIKLAQEVVRLEREYAHTAIDNRCKIAELFQAYRRPRPVPAAPPTELFSKQAAVAPAAVNFAVVAGALKNLMGDTMRPASRSEMVQGTLSDLQDPDHEEELRRIRAQTMLQRFLTDDPVLSGHEPDRVMTAFNELSSLSPRTAQQPAAARSILRKWVTQGAIEPFETREVTDLERNLGEIQGSTTGMPKPPSPDKKEKLANVLSRRNRSVVS